MARRGQRVQPGVLTPDISRFRENGRRKEFRPLLWPKGPKKHSPGLNGTKLSKIARFGVVFCPGGAQDFFGPLGPQNLPEFSRHSTPRTLGHFSFFAARFQTSGGLSGGSCQRRCQCREGGAQGGWEPVLCLIYRGRFVMPEKCFVRKDSNIVGVAH
jgi:hypothetical protein